MKFPEQFRFHSHSGPPHKEGDPYGFFLIPGRHANGRILQVIANDGAETGWDHASVTIHTQPNQTPSWKEMCIVKNLFWEEGETVVEFHPSKQNYVNIHEGCLHFWKCINAQFPTPPNFCV